MCMKYQDIFKQKMELLKSESKEIMVIDPKHERKEPNVRVFGSIGKVRKAGRLL